MRALLDLFNACRGRWHLSYGVRALQPRPARNRRGCRSVMSTAAITTVMAERHVYRRIYLLIAFGVVLFDRLTKYLITANLALHDSVRVIPGLFQITHVQNQGADRKSTRLNSSHMSISYAVFCLKKKKKKEVRFDRYDAIDANET